LPGIENVAITLIRIEKDEHKTSPAEIETAKEFAAKVALKKVSKPLQVTLTALKFAASTTINRPTIGFDTAKKSLANTWDPLLYMMALTFTSSMNPTFATS
jgi:hypothetical protein